MMVIYSILVSIGIIVSKDRSRPFILKAFAVSFAALVLISGLFFAISAYSEMNSTAIGADILSEEPENYTLIKEEELKEYPALKKALETGEITEADSDEWERASKLFDGEYIVQYKGKYYEIYFITA
jgi:hypothetical protein